jgi:hypothetical protein
MNTVSTYFLILYVLIGDYKHASIDIIDESNISFFLSVKLLIAPFDVYIYLHDFNLSFQSNSCAGYYSPPSSSLVGAS